MAPELYSTIGAGIAAIGGLVFLYSTIRGTVQPHRVSWFFWAAFPLIIFCVQSAEGVGSVKWVTFVAGLIPALVFGASFLNPRAYWHISRRDYGFGLLALLILVLWIFTRESEIAIVLTVIADIAVAIPTIDKTFRHPESESWVAYGLYALGYTVALGGVTEWNITDGAFALYVSVGNAVMMCIALRKRAGDSNAPTLPRSA